MKRVIRAIAFTFTGKTFRNRRFSFGIVVVGVALLLTAWPARLSAQEVRIDNVLSLFKEVSEVEPL